MDWLLYWLGRGLIAGLQALPLRVAAIAGRTLGGLAYWLDARHRRMAAHNLAASFPEKAPAEIRALARENFRRIGENFACAAKTAALSAAELAPHLEFSGVEALKSPPAEGRRANRVFAIGHFGNFEIYARAASHLPGYQVATTYRALRQPRLNRLLQSLREKSGCLYFERRLEGGKLREAMRQKNLFLGLLADQHGGRRGLRLPFFGRDCSTNPAPAIFALRYRLPLHTAFCFRLGPARWRLELGAEIPTRENGRARSPAAIMLDVNRAFEEAIRRDPANWFWVHNRWKSPGRSATHGTAGAPPSPSAR